MKPIFNFIRRYTRIQTTKIIFLISITILSSIVSFIPIIFIQLTIDTIFTSSNLNAILLYGGLYLLLQVIGYSLFLYKQYYLEFLQVQIATQIRESTFKALLEAKLKDLETMSNYEALHVLSEDTQAIQQNSLSILTSITSSITLLVFGITYLVIINPYLILILFPLSLITSYFSQHIEHETNHNIIELKSHSKNLWDGYHESIFGIKTLKIYPNPSYLKKLSHINSKYGLSHIKQSKLETKTETMVSLVFMLSIGILMIVMSIMVSLGYLSIGVLVAILMYNHMITDPLIELVKSRTSLAKIRISIQRLETILSLPTDPMYYQEEFVCDEVILKGVSYAYNQDVVFSKVNIHLVKGESILIKGKTGVGKSTLAMIIAGLYSPTQGTCTYKYKNKDITRPSLSYVMQDGYLFDMSIVDNIRLANTNLSDTDLAKLIEICCLEDILEVHKHEPIGKDGALLSGGECKRVLIAQALAKKDPSIIIFDELSTSLDHQTSFRILNNIIKYYTDSILIFIEHHHTDDIKYDTTITINEQSITTVI